MRRPLDALYLTRRHHSAGSLQRKVKSNTFLHIRVIASNFSGGVTSLKAVNWPQGEGKRNEKGENGCQGLN